ncbi:MAG: T9SS type A sorting domain-containing protein [Bacteroidetes bacterium]|nr:T9SS type A sorting domain-containing protein [Bacteroidota bacterium]
MFQRFFVLSITAISIISIAPAQTPTFSEHVAPIIFNHCTSCHRTGEIAPFALTNYSEVQANSQMIKYAVSTGIMPPWKPVRDYGNFVDERRLTPEEKKTIIDWVDGGTPEGDVSKLPKLPTFPEGSQLGVPDLVLQIPVKWKVQGNLQDVYRNFVVPTGLLEDKSIAAIEVRPGNKKVVHHVLMWNDTTGTGRKLDAMDTPAGYEEFGGAGFDNVAASYPGWAPGTTPRYFPAGIGMKLYKNSDIIIQVHYAPSPTDEEDQTSINIFFKKEKTVREFTEAAILPDYIPGGYNAFVIPANQVKTFKATYTVKEDRTVLGVFPHMHNLGKSAKLYAVTPLKDTIKLINIADWDFHWQGTYSYKMLQKVPKNSKLYYEATYDNTQANPNNPNTPPQTVQWGFSTSEEMFLCYVFSMPYQNGDENISQETPTSVTDDMNSDIAPDIIQVDGIFPQPVGTTSHINFTLFVNADVNMDIVDLNGKIVGSKSHIPVSIGQNSIALPEGIPSTGMYVCRIHINGKIMSIPFIASR